MKNKSVIIGIGACLLISVAAGLAIYSKNSSNIENEVSVRYTFTVRNHSNLPLRNTVLHAISPLKSTSFQKCLLVDANQPFNTSIDAFGQQVLTFSWDLFPPHTTKIIAIKSKIRTQDKSNKVSSWDTKSYLSPEPYIESNHIKIRSLAAQLKSNNDMASASIIYKWVSEKIEYSGYIPKTRGALYALKHGKGDCTEYSCLFAALCRANDIPARVVGGFVCPKNTVLDFSDYHNWAEFYAEGRWHIADPQRKRFVQEQETYIAFNYINNEKSDQTLLISEIEGNQLKVLLNN